MCRKNLQFEPTGEKCNRICYPGVVYQTCRSPLGHRNREGGGCLIARTWGEAHRTVTMCVDSYNGGEIRGRFYHPQMPAGKSFHSMTQFLLETEQVLDGMNFPKAFNVPRVFSSPGDCVREEPGEPAFRPGSLATFEVRILFRQNTSWQGSVCWLEGRQEQSFRSVLELILLLDNALGMTKAS